MASLGSPCVLVNERRTVVVYVTPEGSTIRWNNKKDRLSNFCEMQKRKLGK